MSRDSTLYIYSTEQTDRHSDRQTYTQQLPKNILPELSVHYLILTHSFNQSVRQAGRHANTYHSTYV